MAPISVYPLRMPKLNGGQRRALKLLADAADGWTEALLLAYGLSAGLIADLVETKLATAETKRVLAAGRARRRRPDQNHRRWPQAD